MNRHKFRRTIIASSYNNDIVKEIKKQNLLENHINNAEYFTQISITIQEIDPLIEFELALTRKYNEFKKQKAYAKRNESTRF